MTAKKTGDKKLPQKGWGQEGGLLQLEELSIIQLGSSLGRILRVIDRKKLLGKKALTDEAGRVQMKLFFVLDEERGNPRLELFFTPTNSALIFRKIRKEAEDRRGVKVFENGLGMIKEIREDMVGLFQSNRDVNEFMFIRRLPGDGPREFIPILIPSGVAPGTFFKFVMDFLTRAVLQPLYQKNLSWSYSFERIREYGKFKEAAVATIREI